MDITSIHAIVKWQYFLYNHGDAKTIIEDCFPDLAQHLYDKFLRYCNTYGYTDKAWSYWFMELDVQRQMQFADWVVKNYHGVDERLKKYYK